MGERRTNREQQPSAGLGAFLRGRRDAILAEWTQRVKEQVGGGLEPRLSEYVPYLLDRIATRVDGGDGPSWHADERHALVRLDGSFELREVLSELSLIRETVLSLWEPSRGAWSREEHHAFDRTIDDAIARVTDRYVLSRNRLLVALDRISATALDARDLDELLSGLVHVLTGELPAVHTMSISLREGDVLRVRASVGFEEEVRTGYVIPIGVGFAGKIAANRQPFETASASTDPRVISPVVRARGVKALYGVPLIAEGELLGVALMGSLTESAFSQAERLIFDAAAHRATAAIYQHVLRETAEQRAKELARSERRFRAAFENSAVGVAHIHPDGHFLQANPRYCEILGYRRDELHQLTWLDITHPDDRPAAPAFMERLATGEVSSVHVEGRVLRKDGSVGWCDAFFSFVRGETREDSYLIVVLQDIGWRKEAEEALRASEERLRLAVQATGLGTWDYDLQSGDLLCSDRARRICGLAADEKLSCERVLSMVPSEDREALEAVVRAAMEPSSDGVVAHEHRIVRESDCEERWVSTRARVILDAQARPVRVLGTVLDVTEDHRARERTVFLSEASQVLASSLDLDVTLEQLANLAVPRIADLCVVDLVPPPGDLHPRSVIAHADPTKADRLRETHRRARARGGPIAHVLKTGEMLLLSKLDDAALSVLGPALRELVRAIGLRSYLAVPLFDQRTPVGVLSLGQTSARRLGQEDVDFAVELASRASSAIRNASLHTRVNRSVRMREQILGIVSHDLRNPLGVIDMAGQVLLGTESVAADPFALAQTERILRAAERMARLIRDLLDMSSVQAGRLSLERTRCELSSILAEAVEAHADSAREKGVSLELDLAIDGVVMSCDRDRIIQVLGNLLGNAIKFSPSGGRVVLHAEREGPEVLLSVRDEGPGIAPEDHPRVFDPYWHKDKGKRGTGLGLFISKGIVSAHGGRIGVHSRLGAGSTFWLTLPLAS